MNLKLLRSVVFSISILLFSLWIFCIHYNWTYIQNLRYTDPLWLVNSTYPWIYLLLLCYIVLIYIIYKYELNGKLFHIIFICLLILIIDYTPYIMSTFCRFPDTIGVVGSSHLVPEILSGNYYLSYPQSFPLSYLFFYITNLVSKIDLFLFAKLVFTPFVLIAIFSLWYLIVEKIFNQNIAFICTIIAIPSQIIEISITPNSVGIILFLSCLFFCTSSSLQYSILFIISVISLVQTHAINTFVLLVFILLFYMLSIALKRQILFVTNAKIYILIVIWISWLFSKSCTMGNGIVRTALNIFTMDEKNAIQATTYTVGSGGLSNSFVWIQNYNMYKYELFALITILLFIFEIYCIYNNPSYKKNILSNANPIITKYAFLFISFVLGLFSILNLLFSGGDAQNLISRTLNFSMFAISIYIASSFKHLGFIKFKNIKLVEICLILFLLLTIISYPSYSYGRDSYMNYPYSYQIGSDFYKKYSDYEPSVIRYSKSTYFHELMHEQTSLNNITSEKQSVVYANGWYYLFKINNNPINYNI